MNPLDLLAARQRIDVVMHEAEPTAPQLLDRGPSWGPLRRVVAASLRGGGRLLLALSQRLEPSARLIPREQCDA